MNSNESSEKNEFLVSKTKLSETTGSQAEEEASSDPSDGFKAQDNIGIVKSILGPSFEDAVLRTLEFGKALIQKNDIANGETKTRHSEKRRGLKERRKSMSFARGSGDGDKIDKRCCRKEFFKEQRAARRKVTFSPKGRAENLTIDNFADLTHIRPMNVAKIRSLESELKHVAPSPEQIKRQLEALIQINKDEPPDCTNAWAYLYPKDYRPIKPQIQYTVMPSTVRSSFRAVQKCQRDEGRSDGSKACDEPNNGKEEKENCEAGENENGTEKEKAEGKEEEESNERSKNDLGNNRSPEFISSALGPTLDVSIMDNLQLMRNLFKCEKIENNGKGEPECGTLDAEADNEITGQKVEELERRVNELKEKQMKLVREIKQEEEEREARRKAFEEEEKRMQCAKLSLHAEEERVRESHNRQLLECRDYEQKFEALKCMIKSEEDRLNSLKEQSQFYVKELNEAKLKKENTKKNKPLLDAWDVIASKVCHTRLPSFSKVQCLERKSFKPKEVQHCCFPQKSEDKLGREDARSKGDAPKVCRASRSRILECKTSRTKMKCPSKPDYEQVPYPLQRDIICGMHRNIKTCLCHESLGKETSAWSSDDDLRKSSRKEKPAQRSKSETGRKEKSAKLCKVMWAVTRINIFQDNSRTYEVMDATTIPPKCQPVKTEGVFVVKNPKRRC